MYTQSPASQTSQKTSSFARMPAGDTAPLAATLLRQMIAELALLSDSDGAHNATPVLELQLGHTLTRTWLDEAAHQPALMIAVSLPLSVLQHSQIVPSSLRKGEVADCENILFWHADEGYPVILVRKAAGRLADERDVLDAILDAADRASAWYDEAIGPATSEPF